MRVKICCIKNESDLFIALDAGIRYLGFVSAMPSGPGVISDTKIADLLKKVPDDVSSFLLTSKTEPAVIVEQWKTCHTTHLQLCRPVAVETLTAIRQMGMTAKIVSVVHVRGSGALDRALEVSSVCDELLLDTGSFSSSRDELGGTGRVHDWSVSGKIVEQVVKPVWLAGGLRADNVKDAVSTVRPDGLDICSGVRRNGVLDRDELARFLSAVRMAEA